MNSPTPESSDGKTRKRSVAVRGELLRSLRVSRGWTQREAARLAGVSDRLIRKAEAGGPIEAGSIRILSELYQAPETAITSINRLDDSATESGGPQPLSPTAMMAKRFFEEKWNDGSMDLIDEMLHPEFEYHYEFGTVRSPEEMRERVLQFRESFSDFDVEVEEVTDHGDFVVLRWRSTVTHSGVWLDLAPTNRRVTFSGSCWVQVVDGKFGDAWDFWDPGLLYQQLTDPGPSGPPTYAP